MRENQHINSAKALRKNQTDAEALLWSKLRARQLNGAKFRRQHAIGPFIADFACLEHRLIVELDGGQHAEQAGYDQQRSAFLREQGFRVLRFWNHEVLTQTDAVQHAIYDALAADAPPFALTPALSRKRERE
jgi:adenine-specific DNA-methyltransferase